jgi:hypothetical protein
LITLPLASCTHWRQPPPPPSESTGSAPAEPAPAPAMVMLTTEEILDIGIATKSAEPGRDGYILPISFARAIEAKIATKNGAAVTEGEQG